jgi:uncharacterized protein involved in exopolysaccharide biosynthesis
MVRTDEPFDRSPGAAALRNVLKRQRLTIAIVTVVVFGASLAFSFSRTPVYTASASVLVEGPPGSIVAPNMDTEKKVAGSSAVAATVERRAGLGLNTQELLAALSLNVPVGTEVLVVSYSDPDPSRAQKGAEAFAEAYLGFRQQQYVQETVATRDALQTQIDAYTKQLRTVDNGAANGASPTVTAAEAGSLTTLIAGAEQHLTSLTPVAAVSAGQVVDQATVPASPSKPSHVVDGVLGLMLGLLLGIVAGWVRELGDQGIRDAEEAELILHARVAGGVPAGNLLAALQMPHDDEIGVSADVRQVLAKLRSDVMLGINDRDAKSVLLTGCGINASSITAALATSLARGGKSVVVVSTDTDDRGLDELFGTAHDAGLTEVLAGDEVAGVLHPTREPGVMILPAGSTNPAIAELLVSKTMATLVNELEQIADVVLVDVRPLVDMPEAAVVASMCDAALVVVGPGATRSELSEVRAILTRSDCAVLAAVTVNRRLPSLPEPLGSPSSRSVELRPSATRKVAS